MNIVKPVGRDLFGTAGQGFTHPPVEMALSAKEDLLVLARIGASTVASRVGFDIEEIDDLRLAVDELCLHVLQGRRSGRLLLAIAGDSGRIDMWCNYDGPDEPVDQSIDDEVLAGLSGRILDALVDEHGPFERDGLPGAHLCKRHARIDG
jgi:serine/threonine-protein kinase RsbW